MGISVLFDLNSLPHRGLKGFPVFDFTYPTGG